MFFELLLVALPHIRSAQTAFEKGRYAAAHASIPAAVQYFQEAIGIEPTYLEAWRAMIDAQLAQGDSLAAAASLTRLLQIQPEDIIARLRLAKLLLAAKELQRALAQYSIALRYAPSNKQALLGFADAASQLGMNDKASDAVARAQKLP